MSHCGCGLYSNFVQRAKLHFMLEVRALEIFHDDDDYDDDDDYHDD